MVDDDGVRRRSLLASSRLRLVVGVAISAACLYLVFRDVQPRRLLAVFAAVQRGWVIVAVLAVAPAYCATTLRWRLLLLPAGDVPPLRAGRLLAVGYLLNLIFPARPGDVLRCFLVGRPSGPAFGAALTTVVIEKALDGAAVALLLLALLGQLAPASWLRHGVEAAGSIFAVILAAALLIALHGDRSAPAITAILGGRPMLARHVVMLLERIRAGTRAFAQPRLAMGILALTVLIWLSTLATAYCLAAAFGIPVLSSLPALALGAATLGLIVPAAPGGFGAYQVLVMTILTPAGIPAATALAYGLALQFCQILPLAALGAAVAPTLSAAPRPTPGAEEQANVPAPEFGVVEELRRAVAAKAQDDRRLGEP